MSGKRQCSPSGFVLIFAHPDRAMIPELVRNSDDIECIVTNSPQEALILERQLIRQHRPRYNSMLKDDKSYPFLALTKEEFPPNSIHKTPSEELMEMGPFPMLALQSKLYSCLEGTLEFEIAKSCCLKDV